MEATVSEIHAYPLRPEGYAEPLFHDRKSRKGILDHLAKSGWLWRACEMPQPKRSEPVEPVDPELGRAKLAYANSERVLASWREVDRWWEVDGGIDLVWRLVESGRGTQEIRAEPGAGPARSRRAA